MPYKNSADKNKRVRERYHNDPDYRLKHYLAQRKYSLSEKGEASKRKWSGYGKNRGKKRRLGSDYEYRVLLIEFMLEKFGNSCSYCKKSLDKLDISIDHKIAFINGGTNTIDNVQLIHKKCNLLKESERAYRDTISRLKIKFPKLKIID